MCGGLHAVHVTHQVFFFMILGTSRVPLPRARLKNADGSAVPVKYAKFPAVRVEIEECGLGGLRAGTPAGWGVLVCDRATLRMEGSLVEYCHQVALLVQKYLLASTKVQILTQLCCIRLCRL